MKIINWIFIQILKFYKKFISPHLKSSCRFYPTCSEYAIESFQKHWFLKALFKSIYRVLRCNPYNSNGGYDPVIKEKKNTKINKIKKGEMNVSGKRS